MKKTALQTVPSPGLRGRPAARARGAFTLIELLVSLAVVTVALVVVVTAFTITARTAREASAISEVNARLRQFQEQVEQDLRFIDPASSTLVLVGREQKAALTRADLDALRYFRVLLGDPLAVPNNYDPETSAATDPQYGDPRADIVMFVTNRPSVSQAPARNPQNAPASRRAKEEAYSRGAKAAPLMVVYGHAALGGYSQNSSGNYAWTDDLTHIEQTRSDGTGRSVLPGLDWHLARRATLIESLPPDDSQPFQPGFERAAGVPFNSQQFRRLLRCYNAENDTEAADVAGLRLGLWFSVQNPAMQVALGVRARGPFSYYNVTGSDLQYVNPLLYPNGQTTNHHVATVLPEPPAELRSNVGNHLLPGCVWFQVEFLMPEDPRNSFDHPDAYERRAMPRWVGVLPGKTYVFAPDTAENRSYVASLPLQAGLVNMRATYGLVDSGALPPAATVDLSPRNQRIRLWPWAMRLTVKVTDPRGRLSEPITRSIVHRFP
ncbi:MAG: prepilin-type N-terminal cleavage/methylation domain-containing protein [Phycisphaerae bacterium]